MAAPLWYLVATLWLLAGGAGLSAQTATETEPSVERSVKVHAGLYEIATATSDGSVWVAAVGSNVTPGARLVALDPVTLEQRRVIDMSEAPGFGVGINNRTGTLYTSNTRVGNMSAVDLRTGAVTLIEQAGREGNPHLYRVLVDEANNKIYSSVAESAGSIWVVDGATNTLEHVIEDVGARPTGLALDAEANRLFVANQGDDEVAVIDLATRRVVGRIPTEGERSTQLAFDPATKRLFVGNQNTNDISVIDTEEGRTVRRVATGAQPVGVAFHRRTNRIYVASRADGVLTVIDGESYERIADLDIGTYPNTIHVDEATGRVYVTNKAARPPQDQPNAVDPEGDQVTLVHP